MKLKPQPHPDSAQEFPVTRLPSARSGVFSKQHKLLDKRAFDRVFTAGPKWVTRCFVMRGAIRTDEAPGDRIGLIVSRKVGNAVRRNRIKRHIREEFRLDPERRCSQQAAEAAESVGVGVSIDIVVIARPGCDEAGPAQRSRELKKGFKRLRGLLRSKSDGSKLP